MSLGAQVWAWEQPVEGTAKLVLLCLADHADADGWSWPAIPRIAARCGISERTARRALVVLRQGAAFAEVDDRPGRQPRFRLDVRAVLRPIGLPGAGKAAQGRLPLMVVLGSGQNDRGQNGRGAKLAGESGHGGRGVRPSCPDTPVMVADEPVSNQSPNQQQERAPAVARAARIPDDFAPNEAGFAFARDRGVDVAEQVPAFVAYWQGRSGAAATSPDWQARWRTWCIKDAEFRGRSTRVVGRVDDRTAAKEASLRFLMGGGS